MYGWGKPQDWSKGSSKGSWKGSKGDRSSGDGYSSWRNNGKGGNSGGSNKTMESLAEVMMWRESNKLEQEYKRDLMEKEKSERETKEMEAEKAKKERDEFRDEMRKQQQDFLSKLGQQTNAGSSNNNKGGNTDNSGPSGGGARRRRRDDSDAEDEQQAGDYKQLLRRAKKQNTTAPVEAEAWSEWTCSDTMAKSLVKRFPGKCASKDFEGCSLLEIAECLENKLTTSKDTLASRYTKDVGKEPRARWSRVDLLVGLVAHFCEGDSW